MGGDTRARVRFWLLMTAIASGCLALAARFADTIHLGLQPDGSFLVSTAQRISAGTIEFPGRPSDLAVHPGDDLVAVMVATPQGSSVFLCRAASGIVAGSNIPLKAAAGFHGLAWTPDGKRLFASTSAGTLQSFTYDGTKLTAGPAITLAPAGSSGANANAVPGGMAVTKDGRYLFVACANLDNVSQIDLTTDTVVKTFPTGNLPYTVKLSEDENTLIVSNWGGRIKLAGDSAAWSQSLDIVTDSRGAAGSGTVSLIDRSSGSAKEIVVGLHPTDIAVQDGNVWVANTMSDSLTEISLGTKQVVANVSLAWKNVKSLGAMPNALCLEGTTLYVADGGDNAIAVVDTASRKLDGFFPCGYFPVSVASDGQNILVLNSKGNGSVLNTEQGKPGHVSDFQGTITVVNPSENLANATETVSQNNNWGTTIPKESLAVYNGAIQHVLYIIKENRTYDEIFGDMSIGNGDPALADAGAKVMPNHQAIVQEFTLFDNGYVSGTVSADGHAWTDQSLADEYLEKFYAAGYPRSYPFEGSDPMAISTAGCLWDAAAAKHKSIKDFGEFASISDWKITPMPSSWFDCWNDRLAGTHKYTYKAGTLVAGLQPYINHTVQQFPLYQSDQAKADIFLAEYAEESKADTVPNLTFLSLPCDHTSGVNPNWPQPASMMADNDLALGRIVDAVSHSRQWSSTCIFVIEDDSQSGPDHVDPHRTAFMVISPYNKRHVVDSNLYTTTNMVRSIEVMLGLPPMNRFDALSKPIDTCFNDTADLTPYTCVPNQTPLDLKNPGYHGASMTAPQRYWAKIDRSLDWSHLDGPDSYWLNRIIWNSLHHWDGTPYPGRLGEAPEIAGVRARDGDGDEENSAK